MKRYSRGETFSREKGVAPEGEKSRGKEGPRRQPFPKRVSRNNNN